MTNPPDVVQHGAVADWRQDLWINACRKGFLGALHAWFFCPGFKQATLFRLSSRLNQTNRASRFASLIIWRWGVGSSGCYMARTATIGPALHLPHPVGISIGEGVVIGANVSLYQHVTLGVGGPQNPAYPEIGDGVIVYSGAVILGNVRVGNGAIIGANAVVTRDIPAGSIAAGVPAKIIGKRDIAQSFSKMAD